MMKVQFAVIVLSFAAVIASSPHGLEESCGSEDGCQDRVRASAMLQVKAEPHSKTNMSHAPEMVDLQRSGLCAPAELTAAYLEESRDCVSAELQEMHLKAVRRHAAFLAAQSRQGLSLLPLVLQRKAGLIQKHKKKVHQPSLEDMTIPPTTVAPVEVTEAPTEAETEEEEEEEEDVQAPAGVVANAGASASLDAAGFKATTSLCCPAETEVFFNRLLEQMGYDGCSVPHIQGLMHWFTCVPDMDFQYMLNVIKDGNPCKYWTVKGSTCPALSETCQGKFCR